MQNIKNFTEYSPSAEQIHADLLATGNTYRYLVSEDGLDWYDCQRLFSDMTVKVMYASTGVIHSVVSEPVSTRGNIYAVSMFFPDGMSVAEVESLPSGFELNTASWVFDGESVYQDSDLLAACILKTSKKQQSIFITQAATLAFSIQCSAAAGNPRPTDSADLLAVQQYVDLLRDVDLTVPTPAWPQKPECLN